MKEKIKKIYKLLELSKNIDNKYLIRINIDDIIFIGIKNLLLILKKITLRKFNIDLFQYTQNSINTIIKLKKIGLNINIYYNINEENKGFYTNIEKKEYKYNIIDNYIFNIKYNKFNYLWITKYILKINTNSIIYLGLEKFGKQNKDNIKKFLEIFNLFIIKGYNVDKDFIRNESAHKNLYIIGPKEINFDINELCNANCLFCYSNGPGFINNRDDTDNIYKQKTNIHYINTVIKKLEYIGTENILIGTSGEPFLRKEYIDSTFKEINKTNLRVGFLTNGYNLLNNIDTIISSKNIKHFCINISSGDYNSFKATRIGDSFNNFINTWKAIKIIKEHRPDIIIKTLYVVTPLNIDGIKNFVNLSEIHHVNEIEIRKVYLYDLNKKLIFNEQSTKKILIHISNIKNINMPNNLDIIIKELSGKKTKSDSKPKNIIDKCYNHYMFGLIKRDNLYSCCQTVCKIGKIKKGNITELIENINGNNKILQMSKKIKSVISEKKYEYECNKCFQKNNMEIIINYINLKKIIEKIG